MKKVLLFVLIAIMFIIPANAFFTKDHLYATLYCFDKVDSPITQMCRDRINIVLDGNTAADVFVLHYFDEQFLSYVGTHTRGSGYEACLDEAGNDPDLICMCVGVGTHITQDILSHTPGGLVAKYLEKNAAPNLIGHMAVENDFLNKHQVYIRDELKDPIATTTRLDHYDSIVLNTFFPKSEACPECDGDIKYVELLNTMSGIDSKNDLNIFRNGYQGKGFFDTVYNEKVKLPSWAFLMCVSLFIVGFGLATVVVFTGKTAWKWTLVTMFAIVGLIGMLIFISFLANTSWVWTKGALSAMTGAGLLSVSPEDIKMYDEKTKIATCDFLQSGELATDDASGLSYVDRFGNEIKGTLRESENNFRYIALPIATLLLALLISFLVYMSYRNK